MLTLQIYIDRLSQYSVVRLRKKWSRNKRWNGTAPADGHDTACKTAKDAAWHAGYRAREALTYLFVAICHDKDKLL